MPVTRRNYLNVTLGLGGLGLAGCLDEWFGSASEGSSNALQAGAVGCYRPAFAGAQSGAFGCGLRQSSGNLLFDQRLSQEVFIQQSFWNGVPASVFLFDECGFDSANAYATPDRLIMMGLWLMQKVSMQTGSELPIAGILAHEWGHQVQFAFGWMTQTEPTVRRTELEADMWSGLYMALFKSWSGPQIQSYFNILFSIGDYNFNHPSHHGTPNQRLAAGATGFEVARLVALQQVPLNYFSLHEIFLQEVSRITATISKGSEKLDPAVSSAAQSVYSALDHDWIIGISEGYRSLSEKGAIQLPSDGKLDLRPFIG